MVLAAMFRGWCYLYICAGVVTILLAHPHPNDTCAGLQTIYVSRLPRFHISKFFDAAFNAVLLLDTTGLNQIPNSKLFNKRVEGRSDQIDFYEVRGRAPNCNGRKLVIFRGTQYRPGDPCMTNDLIIPPDGTPTRVNDALHFSPDRNTITFSFCLERKGSQCTKGFMCITMRNAMRPLSRKRRKHVLRIHERAGFFKEFGVQASDIEDQDPRLNDCEFPQSILTGSKRQRHSYNRYQKRRKNYRY